MYMWKRFDVGEIREDMALIASLGLRFVRFFLGWEDFQPEPDRFEAVMRERLVAFVDAADGAGVELPLTREMKSHLRAAIEAGYADDDFIVLFQHLRSTSGLANSKEHHDQEVVR